MWMLGIREHEGITLLAGLVELCLHWSQLTAAKERRAAETDTNSEENACEDTAM